MLTAILAGLIYVTPPAVIPPRNLHRLPDREPIEWTSSEPIEVKR